MNNKIHDFNGFQIKLVGVVVIFSVGGGTHLLNLMSAWLVEILSLVAECEIAFHTCSWEGEGGDVTCIWVWECFLHL